MVKKLTAVVLASILLAGCAQFAEMDEAREAGKAYLTGRFEEQICELEAFATAHPELNYTAERIVKEVVPSAKKDAVSFEFRTKYEAPNSKIRLYGKKVKFPITREGVNTWIATIDGNIANLRTKIVSEKAAADERAAEQERIAKEEAARREAERIAREKAEAEDRAKRLVGDVEIPRNRIVNGDSVEVWVAYHGRIISKICDLQPGDIELRGVDKYVWATQQFCQKLKDKERAEQERLAKEAAAEAEMIRKLVAEMPESEKFPLLAIQPNPQLLMKEIPSGASTKWISAWLATNEVSFEGPEKEITTEFGEERLIKRHTGREMIRAEFYRDGKISRYVTFFFKEDALVELNIVIKETTLSTEQLVEKYSAELGGAAKVEYGTNGVPEKIIGDGTVMPFIQDCFVKIQNDDVCVTHSYKEFAGMICLSESTILSLPFMSAASQARHLKLDKDGLADLIIDGDGNVIRCTQDGELVKDMVIKMVPKFRNLAKQNDMHINVKDKKLCSYFDNLKNAKVEAAAKAAEEARKKEEAAALDF